MSYANAVSQKSPTFYALSISIFLHLLIGITFFVIHFDQEIPLSEWVEISIVQPQKSKPTPIVQNQADNMVQKPIVARQRPDVVEQNTRIHLPERKMLEDKTPEIREPRTGKITPDEKARLLPFPLENEKYLPAKMSAKWNDSLTETRMDLPDFSQISEKQSAPVLETGLTVPAPYTIEGEAADRLVIHKVIPAYPSGVQREATVKIRFTVIPNGHIGTTIPLLKGDADLEQVALTALRQWRFNPLLPNSPQKTATGIITFRFILR